VALMRVKGRVLNWSFVLGRPVEQAV